MIEEFSDESRWAWLRSQLECPKCHEAIASIHRHDFQSCHCGETSLDGGLDYMRVAGNWILFTSPEEYEALNKSIFIAGEHNKASKKLALSFYKALWAASEQGRRWATTSDVLAWARQREGKVTDRQLMAYLNMFVESKAVQKKRGRTPGYIWMPAIPLVERPDAP